MLLSDGFDSSAAGSPRFCKDMAGPRGYGGWPKRLWASVAASGQSTCLCSTPREFVRSSWQTPTGKMGKMGTRLCYVVCSYPAAGVLQCLDGACCRRHDTRLGEYGFSGMAGHRSGDRCGCPRRGSCKNTVPFGWLTIDRAVSDDYVAGLDETGNQTCPSVIMFYKRWPTETCLWSDP
jgi:hypothetical protein